MKTLPIFTVPAVTGLAFGLILFTSCGLSDDSAEAAEQGASAQEVPPVEPMEYVVGFMESWIDLFDDMSHAMTAIDSREAANEHAVWLNNDLTPRLEVLVGEMMAFMESIEDHDMEAMEAAFEDPDNQQRMEQLMARMEQSLDRMDQKIMHVERTYATPALEAAWINFGQANERLERHMEATFAGGGEPVVGSPAWCQAMANTPQAQWTMNDAFAFANHCVGR